MCDERNYEMKDIRKKLERNIKLDYMYTALNNLNMMNFVWVLYLSHCGMSLAQIGMLEGIFHVTSTVCEIPSGAISDLFGRRNSMIVGRICIAISCVIMLFTRSFGGFACSFIIQALGYNFNSGSEEALVYDSAKLSGQEENYLKINGRINILIEVSQIFATVVGGVLAEYSYTYCYIACFSIAVFSVAPLLFMTEPPITRNNMKKNSWSVKFCEHFKECFLILSGNRDILKIILFYSGIFIMDASFYFYGQQYFSERGFDKIQIGFLLMSVGIASSLGAVLSERVYRKIGEMISGIHAICISICIVTFGIGGTTFAMVAFVLPGFLSAMLYPVQSNILNSLIPSEQRATLISVNSMCFSMMMIITFPVIGGLADEFGLDNVFTVLGIIFLVCALGCFSPLLKSERKC